MNVLRRYLVVLVASISLLFGIQVPNFVDQYEKRVDAHFVEVANNLRHYQEIATQRYNGSIYALIAHHRNSADKTFQEEGTAINEMHQRKMRFEADRRALNGGFLWKAIHLALNGDRELLKETATLYSYAVPLNQDAIVAGVVLMAATVMLLEILFGLLGSLVRLFRLLPRRGQKKVGKVLAPPPVEKNG